LSAIAATLSPCAIGPPRHPPVNWATEACHKADKPPWVVTAAIEKVVGMARRG
jgi:hypothetical protein